MTTIGAKLRARSGFNAATGAELLKRYFLSAIGAKLRAARHKSAARTQQVGRADRLLARCGGSKSHSTRQINRTAVSLLTYLPNSAFAFDGGQFLIHFGRTHHALMALAVPADGAAHPLPATVALVELRRHFLNSLAQCGIVSRATDQPLNIIRRRRRPPENAAEQTVGHLQSAARHVQDVVLKSRQITVSTTLAAELELKTFIGRKVLNVVGERNRSGHEKRWLQGASQSKERPVV